MAKYREVIVNEYERLQDAVTDHCDGRYNCKNCIVRDVGCYGDWPQHISIWREKFCQEHHDELVKILGLEVIEDG